MSVKDSATPDLSKAAQVRVKTGAPVAGQVSSAKVSHTKQDPERELTEEDRKRIDKVKKVMFDFSKTVRSFSLYNQNNEAIRQFIQNLFDSLTVFLEEETVLSLRIRAESVYYEEELVYENSNREESIAVKLYKDGIKEIVFQKGLEKKELVDLIDIMNINLDQPEYFDEDIVSLMWERDFENISYFVIEGFSDDMEQAKKDQIENDIELILSLVHTDKPPDHALKSAHLSKDDVYQFFKRDDLDKLADDNVGEMDDFKSHFLVSADEVRKIRKEIEQVSDAELIFQMVDIIISILAKETDHDSFTKIGDVLVQILDMLLLRSDFSNATKIIKRLRELVVNAGKAQDADSDDRVMQRALVTSDFHSGVRLGTWIEEVIERMGEEQRLSQVVSALNQGFKGKPSEIFDYIISLNASSVTPVVNLLGDVSNLTHRRLICDAVLIIHDGDITKFAQKLYDERWFVVSDMLYILGKIGHADALNYMMKACEHENPKVRGEALAALRRFPAEKVRHCYISALRDENLQVQLQALRALAQSKDHGSVDQILEIIEARDFMDFPLSVKKRFFMTLAMIEGVELTEYFVKTLARNRFWLGNFNTEVRVCAAFSLGIIGNKEALSALKKYRNTWSRNLRDACSEAIHRSQHNTAADNLILEPLSKEGKPAKGRGELILEPLKK